MKKRLTALLLTIALSSLPHLGGISGCGAATDGDGDGGGGPLDCGEVEIAAVSALQASDGTFTSKVALSWQAPFLVETVDNEGAVSRPEMFRSSFHVLGSCWY